MEALRSSVLPETVAGDDFMLHQAALGPIPCSIADPSSNRALSMASIQAARCCNAKADHFISVSELSIYGDEQSRLRFESRVGRSLSLQGLTTSIDKIYADRLSGSPGPGRMLLGQCQGPMRDRPEIDHLRGSPMKGVAVCRP
jgi:hypothetical protein